MYPYGQQPQQVVVNYYHAPARRTPDAGQAFGWVGVGGVVVGVPLAVASLAIALGLAAIALAITSLVLRAIWRDFHKRA